MSTRTLSLTDDLHAYLVAHGAAPDPVAQELIEATHAIHPDQAIMQVAPEQAAFLQLLARIIGARHAVEVGTFTGYSALAIARGLAPGGRLVCCDISAEYTSMARQYWARAGVADRIELRLGPAAETLRAMPGEPHIDLAFIDADKSGYPTYWAELVPRMRPGGLILVDNVLRHGRVLDPAPDDEDTRAIVRFNADVLADERMESVMLPIADGLTLARRR
ncbi:MAG TPA: O-methyltransferase [Micromonosporaceae bacterium]|nr:O-methyltransferase [Micromonosporaceae bacterium]